MKKSLLTITLGMASLLTASAQLSGNGFYRVQNTATNRFIVLLDNKTNGIQMGNGDADQNALATLIPGTDNANVISNPASVFYITKATATQYNLKGQGTDAHSFIGYYLTIENSRKVTGAYTATGEAKGFSLRLGDSPNEGGRIWFGNEDKGETLYKSDMYWTVLKGGETYWYIKPVSSASSDCFFGIRPDIKADGKYYKSFYAGFGFKPLSAGVKAKYITKVDNRAACAVYQELTGTVAQSIPMFIECTSDQPANNKLELVENTAAGPQNCLTGVYFNHEFDEYINSIHNVQTPYDATTMRILGICKDGSLGYVKSATLKYIPANTAYLKVTADAPDELKVVSEEEYKVITGIQDVKMDDDNTPADIYDMTGVKVRSNATTTEGLKKGIYIFKGKKVMVD